MITKFTLLSVALVANATTPVRDITVEVQAQDVNGEREPVMEQQLHDKLAAAFGDHGVTLVEGEAQGRVIVDVRRVDIIDYEVAVRVEVDGAVVEPGVAAFPCAPCRVVELQDRVVERVPEMVDALELPSEPTGSDAESSPAEPEVIPDSGTTAQPSTQEPRPRTIGALGISGSVVAAFGLGALSYGAVLAARGTTTRPDAGDDQFDLRESHDRPAWTWLGVGIGGTVVGATMLVVDLTILRKRRQQRVAVHPWTRPGEAGLTARLRF